MMARKLEASLVLSGASKKRRVRSSIVNMETQMENVPSYTIDPMAINQDKGLGFNRLLTKIESCTVQLLGALSPTKYLIFQRFS